MEGIVRLLKQDFLTALNHICSSDKDVSYHFYNIYQLIHFELNDITIYEIYILLGLQTYFFKVRGIW